MLAAILAADIAGYSVLMNADEARTVQDLKGHQAVVLPMIGRHGGRIIDTAGDGILAEFTPTRLRVLSIQSRPLWACRPCCKPWAHAGHATVTVAWHPECVAQYRSHLGQRLSSSPSLVASNPCPQYPRFQA